MSNTATGFINDVYSYGNTGSSMANAVSYGAQQNQFDYNSEQAQEAYNRQIDLASMQMAYNSAQAADQRAYNEAMWQKQVEANRENMLAQQAYNHAEAILAREFSSQEAEKNRSFQSAEAALAREFSKEEALALRKWQEKMSNTSYQRAVQDMKLAGINPILAYAQGGASTPGGGMGQSSSASGSMASTSMASSGLANSSMASSGMASMGQVGAPSASGSNFTGQGNNMSENLAIMGAIASTFGQGMSALAESFNLKDAGESIVNGIMKLLGKDVTYENGKDQYGNTYYYDTQGNHYYNMSGGNYGNGPTNEARQNEVFWNAIEERLGLTHNQRWNGKKH